jgi:hypothetical protein
MRNQRGCRAVRLLRDDRAVAYGDRARHGFALEVSHLDPAVSQLGGHFVSGLRAGTRNRRDGGRCPPGHAGGRVTSPSTRPARGPKKAAKADAMCHEVARRGLGDRLGAALQTNPLRSGRDLDAMTDAGSPGPTREGAYLWSPPEALAFGERGHGRPSAWLATCWPRGGQLRPMTRRYRRLLLARGSRTSEQLLGVRPDSIGELSVRDVLTRPYVP